MPIKFIASALIAALLMTGTPTGVSPASGQGAQLTQTTAAETAALTEAEAVAAALAHAKLTEEEVTGLRARLDRDDGRQHWEVRFRSGDWEYDYDIDRNTGAVLEWDRDYEPARRETSKPAEPKPTEPPATEPPATEPPATQLPKAEKTYLSADEAKAIALKHAGLSAGQVKGLRAEFDRDDGKPVYEIEFRADGYEYDYEIHAESGRILEYDRERDD